MIADPKTQLEAAAELEQCFKSLFEKLGSNHAFVMSVEAIGYSVGNGAVSLEQINITLDVANKLMRDTAINVFLGKGRRAGRG